VSAGASAGASSGGDESTVEEVSARASPPPSPESVPSPLATEKSLDEQAAAAKASKHAQESDRSTMETIDPGRSSVKRTSPRVVGYGLGMRTLIALLVLAAGCKQESPPPPPASTNAGPAPVAQPTASLAKPSAPAVLSPDQKLGFADFWEVAGVSRTDTPASVKAKWGEPKSTNEEDDTTLRYDGASVTFGDDKSVLLDFTAYGESDHAFAAAHPSAPLALLGMTCDEAAKHLAFTDKVEEYTTCKHYDKSGYLVDVTMMCMQKVSSLVVVWTPIPPGVAPIADHCGMPKE
jgi:hypothetical protein